MQKILENCIAETDCEDEMNEALSDEHGKK